MEPLPSSLARKHCLLDSFVQTAPRDLATLADVLFVRSRPLHASSLCLPPLTRRLRRSLARPDTTGAPLGHPFQDDCHALPPADTHGLQAELGIS